MTNLCGFKFRAIPMNHETEQPSSRPYAFIGWLIINMILNMAFVFPALLNLAQAILLDQDFKTENTSLVPTALVTLTAAGGFFVSISMGYLVFLYYPHPHLSPSLMGRIGKWLQVGLCCFSFTYLLICIRCLYVVAQSSQPLNPGDFAPSGLGLFLVIGQIWALRLAFRHKETAA